MKNGRPSVPTVKTGPAYEFGFRIPNSEFRNGMTTRPFKCTPSDWNRDPILNAVSWEAEFLFRRIALEVDRDWRIEVDREEVARSVRLRALEPTKRYRAWQESKVARCLDELRATGIVILLCQGGRSWLQVARHLQYVKGSVPINGPEEAEQEELRLPLSGPELFVMAPAKDPSSIPKSAFRVPHWNEITSREDKDKTSTRAPSAQEQELFDLLTQILPPSELLLNGGMWRMRIRHCPKAVAYAIEDYKVRTPDQRREIKNLPAWLTDRHTRALVESTNQAQVRREEAGK